MSILSHHFGGLGGFGTGTRQAAMSGAEATRHCAASKDIRGEGLMILTWILGCQPLSGQRVFGSLRIKSKCPLGQIPKINITALVKFIFLIILSSQILMALLNHSISKLPLQAQHHLCPGKDQGYFLLDNLSGSSSGNTIIH